MERAGEGLRLPEREGEGLRLAPLLLAEAPSLPTRRRPLSLRPLLLRLRSRLPSAARPELAVGVGCWYCAQGLSCSGKRRLCSA